MLFQTLGSNFRFADAIRHLYSFGGQKQRDLLLSFLEKRYGGRAVLYYKGRAALAEAVRIAVEGNNSGPKKQSAGTFVAINGFTCYSVEQAVKHTGAKPVFIDIERGAYHFNIKSLQKAYESNPNIRAIIIQNTFGIVCDIGSIEQFAKEHGIILIEDTAHSIGGYYKDGRKVGTVGDIVMFSFGRDKLIDAVNGGALVVRNQVFFGHIQKPVSSPSQWLQFRDRIYPILTWKIRVLYKIYIGKALQVLSYKLRFIVRSADGPVDTKQALPGWYCRRILQDFTSIERILDRRRSIAKQYTNALGVEFDDTATYNRFPLLVSNRDKVLGNWAKQAVFLYDTWYDTPISPRRFMQASDYRQGACQASEEVCATVINLPTHRNVKARHIQKILDLLKDAKNV